VQINRLLHEVRMHEVCSFTGLISQRDSLRRRSPGVGSDVSEWFIVSFWLVAFLSLFDRGLMRS
jgi:hypothetical protein